MNDQSTMAPSDFSILYVDDEEMALKYFRRAVGNDHAVHTAGDVEEGLAVLNRIGAEIGVLITDQRMPGQSGVDLLKKVRERWPHIVRVLTTAYADLDDAIEAVNRGEIFRYITKPWDIKSLRAEVNQAMEVFRLRYENAAMMREKLSVWQRLIQLGRIRDLIVMAGSIAHLDHSESAVAAYLQDHLEGNDDDFVEVQHLDLWGLTEAEIQRTLAFVHAILERSAAGAAAEQARLTPREIIAMGGETLGEVRGQDNAALPAVQLQRASTEHLLQELAAIRAVTPDEHRQARIDSGQTRAGAGALILHVPVPERGNLALTASEAAGPLVAYLLAYHLRGSLERFNEADGVTYRLALPEDQDSAPVTALQPGWLESLLVRLESWD